MRSFFNTTHKFAIYNVEDNTVLKQLHSVNMQIWRPIQNAQKPHIWILVFQYC